MARKTRIKKIDPRQLGFEFGERVFQFGEDKRSVGGDTAIVPPHYLTPADLGNCQYVGEGLVEAPVTQIVTPKLVVPKYWDLRKMDLSHFSKYTLEDIYYGTWNLSIPTEMLDVQNPSEFIGNCLAAGLLKRYNSHRSNESIPRGSFSGLVKYMNKIAYSNPIFARNSHYFKRRFSALPGEQEKRLEDLPGNVKREFYASFAKPYRASKDEQPEDPYAFKDPHSRQGYIDGIFSYFQRRFESGHSKK